MLSLCRKVLVQARQMSSFLKSSSTSSRLENSDNNPIDSSKENISLEFDPVAYYKNRVT